jgi:hypothetical protein
MPTPVGSAPAPSAAVIPATHGVPGDERPPNLLVIVLDCARAKSFRWMSGEAGARTPAIDALARQGTIFPNAVAPSNWTIPSHMSIFTGAYPNVHGLRTFRAGQAPIETTAAWLGRRGYDTGLFTEMVHLVAGYGLEDGFQHRSARHVGMSDERRTTANRLAYHADVLYSPWVRRLIERVPPLIVPLNLVNHPQEVAFKEEVCGSFVLEAFEKWLGTRDPARPFHAFFNLVDAHEPYPIIRNGHWLNPLSKWYARTPRYYLLSVPGLQEKVPWEELIAGYQWSIEQADRKIARIVAALERAGERERTMIVVSSDHGQSFGEGGNVFHGCGATESISRIPLVVAPPAHLSVPARVDRWTSLCELSSWLKAASTGQAPYDEQGHAPLPFVAMAPSDETVYCEGAPASDPNKSLRGIRPEASWNRRLLAAYRPGEKYVLDLEAGTIHRWFGTRDLDRETPEIIVGREAARLRASVFGEYEGAAPDASALAATAGETELDRRLRSWGYD